VTGAGAGVRHHRRVVMLVVRVLSRTQSSCSCLPVMMVPVGRWRSLSSSGGSAPIHPGAMAHRAGDRGWVVPRHRGALVLVFIVVGWLSIVGDGVCCFGAIICNLKIMRTVK
jgi:hypothetical protein